MVPTGKVFVLYVIKAIMQACDGILCCFVRVFPKTQCQFTVTL
jgi:hypothetical protein